MQVVKNAIGGNLILWSYSTRFLGLGKTCLDSEKLGLYCGEKIAHRDLILCKGQTGGFPEFIKYFLRGINKKESVVRAGDIKI